MLPRILEPELMETPEDAREYDAMDHSIVNALFVTDLLDAVAEWSLKRPDRRDSSVLTILDLGAGTAQIPIEIAGRVTGICITAIDAAESMLAIARKNIAATGLDNSVNLILADAKRLPFSSGMSPIVISNSIVHHVADPQTVLTEALRVTAPGGLLFHRDLARPADDAELRRLVETYAADSTSHQRKLFVDSLRAALTLDELRDMVANLGFSRDTVQMTSDRHWTWVAIRDG